MWDKITQRYIDHFIYFYTNKKIDIDNKLMMFI